MESGLGQVASVLQENPVVFGSKRPVNGSSRAAVAHAAALKLVSVPTGAHP